LYEYQRAERYLEQVLNLGSASAKALHLVGQSYRMIRRHEEAVVCFLRALQIDGDQPETHLELAILYERANQLTRAMHHVEMRLKRFKSDGEGRFLHGRILRRQGCLDQARETLERLVSETDIFWLTRARAWAELARVLERQGLDDQAWQAMRQGKRLFLPHAGPHRSHRDQLVRPLSDLAGQIQEEDIQQWRHSVSGQPQLHPTPVLLTGFPRSGSTLLAQLVSGHPEIRVADEYDLFPRLLFPLLLNNRKPSALSREALNETPSQRIEQLRGQHQNGFAQAIPGLSAASICIDKFPSLLPLLPAYLRIFPLEKIVVMVRDPRDTLISCLMTYLPLNDFSVDFLDLETAVSRLESDWNVWLAIRQQLPKQQWLEVPYESLVTGTHAKLETVAGFLGLAADGFDSHDPSGAPRSPVFSPSYEEVAQPIYTDAVGRWQKYQSQLAPVLQRLEALRATMQSSTQN
jgi:hypothetical protein